MLTWGLPVPGLWFMDETESPMDVAPICLRTTRNSAGTSKQVKFDRLRAAEGLCRAFAHQLGTFFWSSDFPISPEVAGPKGLPR